jgi:hypothetical protein
MKALWAILLAGFLLVLSPAAGGASPVRQHTVSQILRDGSAVASAGVTLTFQGGKVAHSIKRSEMIPDGTRIDVPAHVKITLLSSGAKSTITLGPNSTFTLTLTGKGESSSLDRGSALFSVVHGALDFFQVIHTQQFTASVKGTEFSMDASGRDVTFVCTRGTVDIKKSGLISVGKVSKKISLVDVISADGQRRATYQPTAVWYLAKFATTGDADAYFRDRLAAARRTGDPARIAAATLNLAIVDRLFGNCTARGVIGSIVSRLPFGKRHTQTQTVHCF